jgi:TonB family protein
MRSQLPICPFLLLLLFTPGAVAQDAGKAADPPAQSEAPKPNPSRIRVGGNAMQASLVHQVQPVYPQIAKAARISGTVVLHAIVAKDGTITHLEYVSGHPLLMKAAMDAVSQWVYKPTLMNGDPVEVDTTINVVFQLAGASNQESQPSSIDPQFKADLERMIELSQMKDRLPQLIGALFDGMTPTLRQSLPPTQQREKILEDYKHRLANLLTGDEFTAELVVTYAKYLTHDDVKGIIQFYGTPAGQHLLEVTPKMATEFMGIGQRMAARHIPDIIRQLCKDYPELQGDAKFCPSDPAEKRSLLLHPQLPFAPIVQKSPSFLDILTLLYGPS